MKKIVMLFSFFAFATLASVNAQSCHSAAKASSCCAKKSSTTSTTTTGVAGEEMVKKVANTNETKAACCSKGSAASCKKDASSCNGAGKTTDATAPKQTSRLVKVAPAATTEAATPTAADNK